MHGYFLELARTLCGPVHAQHDLGEAKTDAPECDLHTKTCISTQSKQASTPASCLQAHTHALGTLETFFLRGGGPSTSPLSHGEK